MRVTVSILVSGFSPRTPREAIATACERPCLRVAQKETRRDRTFHDPRLCARTSPAHVEKRTWTFRSPCPDRKSTRLNSSHANISYAVFCLKKKKKEITTTKNIIKQT